MRKTHGEIRSVEGRRVASGEYRSWQMMKNRCLNPRAQDYKHYGAKGVSICPEWRTSFVSFLADMGRRPTPEHTLERKDTTKGYGPDNCAWETRLVQSRNRPYAKTKAWLLADQLGVKVSTARHMLMQVRAKDRGNLSWFTLSSEREAAVRAFIESVNCGKN